MGDMVKSLFMGALSDFVATNRLIPSFERQSVSNTEVEFLKNNLKKLQLLVAEEDGRQFLSGFDDPGCPEGVPIELALLSILSAFGVAFGVRLNILI